MSSGLLLQAMAARTKGVKGGCCPGLGCSMAADRVCGAGL